METIEKASSKRECWFRISYVSVTVLIAGIFFLLVGAILLILKYVKFQTKQDGKDFHYFIEKKIPKKSGPCLVFLGAGLSIVGFIFYRKSMREIDYYIKLLNNLGNQRLAEHARIRDELDGNHHLNNGGNPNELNRLMDDRNSDKLEIEMRKVTTIPPKPNNDNQSEVIYENIEQMKMMNQSLESVHSYQTENSSGATPKVKPRISKQPIYS